MPGFTYANAGLLNSGVVLSELENAGRTAGLKADEIKSTTNSGRKNAIQRPLDVDALRSRLMDERAA